jgi:hypothetical protein
MNCVLYYGYDNDDNDDNANNDNSNGKIDSKFREKLLDKFLNNISNIVDKKFSKLCNNV